MKIKPVQNKRVPRLPKAQDGQTALPEDEWEQELPGDIEQVSQVVRPKCRRKKKPTEREIRLGGAMVQPEVWMPKDDDKAK